MRHRPATSIGVYWLLLFVRSQLHLQKIGLAEKIAHCGLPLRSFDDTLRTALDFLGNSLKLWVSERLEDKRTVLKLAFADRLAYTRNEGLRTPNLALPFKVLADLKSNRNGAPGGTRTPDHRLRRPVLYPAELRARETRQGWSGREDSNLRPSAPKADALPDCATPRPGRHPSSFSTARNAAAETVAKARHRALELRYSCVAEV